MRTIIFLIRRYEFFNIFFHEYAILIPLLLASNIFVSTFVRDQRLAITTRIVFCATVLGYPFIRILRHTYTRFFFFHFPFLHFSIRCTRTVEVIHSFAASYSKTSERTFCRSIGAVCARIRLQPINDNLDFFSTAH